MKKHLIRIVGGLIIVALFVGYAAKIYDAPLIRRLEAIAYDARVRLTMPRTVDQRVVVLDIDEKSLSEEGRWPWRRDRLGLLLDKLFDHYGIAVVGFDVVFAERDESSGLKVLEDLGRKQLKGVKEFQSALSAVRPGLQHDEVFARKMRGRKVVLGYYFSSGDAPGQGTKSGLLPPPVLGPDAFAGRPVGFTTWSGYGSNLPEFVKNAAGAGHFNPWVDEDGVSRRVPMLAEYQGAYYESLSLAVIRALLGSPPVVPGFTEEAASQDYTGLEWLEVGPIRIPVDEIVSTLVPYRGPQGSFPYISVSDVLRERVPVAALKGKIALIGTTAPGLLDLRSTPVAPVYPGVEIHANLIAGMLDQKIPQKPPYVIGVEVASLFVSGLLLALLLPVLSPFKGSLVTCIALGGALAVNVAAWHYGNIVLPIASGILMIFLLFAFNMSYGFFVETRAKRQITGLFGQYVPPELVDEMSQNPESFSMEGESREMSVLFSDVRGFTTISEGLDPKELSRLMNEFLTPLTRVIYKHRGTIDKYMGDCIMAFWGAPLADPDHARNAVLAGLELQATLDALQPHFKAEGWPEIRVGVGVNSGRMSVGNMGSEIRLAYTVMGDAVNLASRLEGITKQYGVGMIVGEQTRAWVPDMAFREIDRVKVKGKEEPVAIFEPIGLIGEVEQGRLDELELFAKALRHYRSQEWDMAELQLLNLQKAAPQATLYALYLERIAHFRAAPPGADWDGVFTFETK